MEPENLKAPYIAKDNICKKADDFRKKFCGDDNLPIPIIDIAEFELEIDIVTIPQLKEEHDVDALLLSSLDKIIVDKDDFMDDRMQNRLRFSMAHEIGHRQLHSDIYSGLEINSIDNWITCQQRLPDDQYRWIEMHANEFAGRLLVPRDELRKRVETAKRNASDSGFTDWDNSKDEAIQYMASNICREFKVSSEVIERRIRHENLY